MAYRIKSKTATDSETGQQLVYEYIYDEYGRLVKIMEDNVIMSTFEYCDYDITSYVRYDKDGNRDFESTFVTNKNEDGSIVVSKNVTLSGKHFFGLGIDPKNAKDGKFSSSAISGPFLYTENSNEQIDIIKKIYTWNTKISVVNQTSHESMCNINEYICIMNDYMNFTCMEDDKRTIDVSYYYGAADDRITIERNIYTDKNNGQGLVRYIFNDYDENGIIYQQRIFANDIIDNKYISRSYKLGTIDIEVEYFESKIKDDDYLIFTLPYDSIAIRKL